MFSSTNKEMQLFCVFWKALQEHSQKTKKVMHIKGRLPGQTVILLNCTPFQYGNFSIRKEFAPRGKEFIPLRAVPYGMENHFHNIR